jgi:hypothetical protein
MRMGHPPILPFDEKTAKFQYQVRNEMRIWLFGAGERSWSLSLGTRPQGDEGASSNGVLRAVTEKTQPVPSKVW